MPFERAKPGDVQIHRPTWNTLVEIAERSQGGTGGGTIGFGRNPGIVKVKNGSGSTRNRYEILGITGVVYDPATYGDEFRNEIVLVGGAPSTSTAGRFVVLLETIGSNEIGYAVASGLVQCQVNLTDTGHKWADTDASDCTKLKSGDNGSAKIFAIDSGGTGTKWAIVRLDAGEAAAHEEITVVTAFRVDAATMKLQVKTRTAKVLDPGTESDWTDAHTGTDQCP